jgi:hypothetical protein
VDDEVRSELERALEERAHERIVHDQQRAPPVGGLGERGHVADLHERVGRGLDPEEVELAGGAVERPRIARVQERELHAVPRQDLREQAVSPSVNVVGDDHALAGLDQRHHGVGGGQAGGEAIGVGAALEGGQVLLERPPGRVVGARVLIPLVTPDPFLHVSRRLEDGRHDGARGRVRLLPSVNAIGGEAHAFTSLSDSLMSLASI